MKKNIPGLFTLVFRLMKCLQWRTLSFQGKIGLALLVGNFPIGWGGAAFCGIMAARNHSTIWGTLAAVVYGLSWGMLGLGILLAGKDVVSKFNHRKQLTIGAWKRLRAARKTNISSD